MPVYSSGTMIADRYEIVQGPREKRSLMGGMGIVYFCFDHREQRPIALKTFRPELLPNRLARDRFLREATTWVNLGNHPHIVRAYNAERVDNKGEIYLILELVAKEESRVDASLRSWLISNSSLPVEQALLFGWQIVRGLRHATSIFPGLVHRDLKPENVLVGSDRLPALNVNRVRVTDFGLANALLTNQQQSALTGQQEQPGPQDIKRTQLTKGIVGTPLYMAPEQWRGESLDMRTDVYALGCILYEMLTGRYAVTGVTSDDLRQAHQQGKIQPLPAKLPQNVVDIVFRCLAAKAEDRYNSWVDIEVALSKAYKIITKLDLSEIEPPQVLYRLEQVALGRSYSALGASYLDISNAKVAINYYERAEQIGQAENDELLVGASLTGLGLAYRELGCLSSAVEKFEQALRIANLVGDQRAEGAVLNDLGTCYRRLGKLEEALECHQRRLALGQELNDQAGIGNALSGLGFIFMERGRPDIAVDYHQKHLTITQALEDPISQSGALLNLGICYFQLGQISEAKRHYQQAVELAHQIGELRVEMRALASLGMCSLQTNLQTAIDYSKQALDLARSINDDVSISGILGVLATALHQQGQWKEAEAMWRESLEISDQIGTISTSAGTCLALATLMLQQGRLPESLPLAERALQIFMHQGAPAQIQHTQELVLHIQRMMQKLK